MTTRGFDPVGAEDHAADPAADATEGSPVVDDREPETIGQKVFSLLRELVIVVVGALIVSSLLRAFVGQMFIIPSGSMEDTLEIDDRVVAQKITDFERGQIVVFADPGEWMADHADERTPARKLFEFVGVLPNTETDYLIKRVIGMPGDTVVCCDADGRLTVNGQPLEEDSYLYREGGLPVAPSEIQFTVVVPEGRIFVMGDHRNGSADSRCHLADRFPGEPDGMRAFVPIDNVVGTAVAILAPLNRFSALRTPDTYASVPAPAGPAPAEPTIEPAGVHC